MKTFVLVHEHKFGVDTRVFTSTQEADKFEVDDQFRLARELGIDYDPDCEECLKVTEVTDIKEIRI